MGRVTSRARNLTALVVIITVVSAGVAAMIAVTLLGESDGDDPSASAPSVTGPTAVVHESLDEACAALEDAELRGKSRKSVAEADQAELVDEYLSDSGQGPAVGLGLTICARGWVIVVGARSIDSVLPKFGPRGTPVIAHFQPPLSPLVE